MENATILLSNLNPGTGVSPALIPIIIAALVVAAMVVLSIVNKKKGGTAALQEKGEETPDELHRDSGSDEESGTES